MKYFSEIYRTAEKGSDWRVFFERVEKDKNSPWQVVIIRDRHQVIDNSQEEIPVNTIQQAPIRLKEFDPIYPPFNPLIPIRYLNLNIFGQHLNVFKRWIERQIALYRLGGFFQLFAQ